MTHFFDYPSTRDKTIKWVHCEEVGGQSAGQYQKILVSSFATKGRRIACFPCANVAFVAIPQVC